MDLEQPLKTPVVLALMTCLTAFAAADTRVDRAGAKRNVVKLLGPTVVECGTFAGQPYRTARKLSPSDNRAVRECITMAWKARKPFVFAVEGSAIDSWVATGLLGTKEGNVKAYWYDSAPCGNDACSESFEVFDCVVASGAEHLDPAMKCTDAEMPQAAQHRDAADKVRMWLTDGAALAADFGVFGGPRCAR